MRTFSEWLPVALGLALLAMGLFCLVTRRRVMKQIIGLSIMLQGALLILLDAGQVHDALEMVQSLIISVLVVEAIVLSIGLTLVVNVFRFYPTGDVDEMDRLKG
jgi:NADH:ubiquinone oxidoreductase subunit K